MPDADNHAEEAEAWHAFFFPPGAPDVLISGLDLHKAMIRPVDEAHGAAEPGEGLRWTVGGACTPPGASPPFIVVGDLQIRQGQYFIGCQVIGQLQFRTPELCPATGDDAAGRALAAWASSALYDFASTHARTLAGGSVTCEIEVPRETPRANLDGIKLKISSLGS